MKSKRGVRKVCQSETSAFYFRNRLNWARRLEADVNRRVYAHDPGNPLWGDSPYYKFSIVVERIQDRWYVTLLKRTIEDGEVTEIEPWESEEERIAHELDEMGLAKEGELQPIGDVDEI